MNIPVVVIPNYEADDVIGTLAKQAAKSGYTVYMVTPDKDYGQLVDEKIKIYKPGRGGEKPEVLGVKEVCEKWGIPKSCRNPVMTSLFTTKARLYCWLCRLSASTA